MSVRLVVTEGNQPGKEFVLAEDGAYELGSQRDLAISLDDTRVAAVHCRILRTKDDRFAIRDVSGRGVFVNDKKVIHTWLDDEDMIRVGGTCLQFVKGVPGWAVPSPLQPRPAPQPLATSDPGVYEGGGGSAGGGDFHMALSEARYPAAAVASSPAPEPRAEVVSSDPEGMWQRPGGRREVVPPPVNPDTATNGYVLKVLEGKNPGRVHTIHHKRSTLIGRGLSADIPVLDHKASRNHCRLDMIDGQVFLTDLGSTNGVRVNGVRIERVRLKSGDRVRIGSTIFLFTPPKIGAWVAEPAGDDVMTPDRPIDAHVPGRGGVWDSSANEISAVSLEPSNGERPPSPSDPPVLEDDHQPVRPPLRAAARSRKRSYVEIGAQSGFWKMPGRDSSRDVAIFPGRVLAARYEIVRHVDAQRDSGVFVARDLKSERESAIKLFLPDLLRDKKDVEKFLEELRLNKGVRHTNVVAIRDTGRDRESGLLYLVMDQHIGRSLAQMLEEQKTLPANQAVTIARQVLSALAYAHKKDVLHRDLSPANILVEEAKGPKPLKVRVLHFGVVQALAATVQEAGRILVGTPGYMSLEHISGKEVGPTADIFSVGVLLYRMLSGRLPWEGEEPVQLSFALVEEDPYPLGEIDPGLDARLVEVIHKALAVAPEERFQSAEAFDAELERVLESTTELKRVEKVRAPRPWRRLLVVLLVCALLAVGVVQLVSASGWFVRSDPGVLTAAEAALPIGALTRREAWNAATPQDQDAVIGAVQDALGADFQRVATKVYRVGELEHRIGVFRHVQTGMLMHLIPGGEGVRPLLVARHELLQREWDSVKAHESLSDQRFFSGAETLPLERFTRAELAAFEDATGLRLPTDTEWLHAARAGSAGPTFWGNGDPATWCWSEANADGRLRPASDHEGFGNAFGLVDVLGNLEEMVQSEASLSRRGGSWVQLPEECVFDSLRPLPADARSFAIGARLVRSLPDALFEPGE